MTKQTEIRRCMFLRGESWDDMTSARTKAVTTGESIHHFEARRLVARGWSSAHENSYRQHGAKCGFNFPDDGRALIRAMQMVESVTDPEARVEREAIQGENDG